MFEIILTIVPTDRRYSFRYSLMYRILVAVYLLFVSYNCVTCCEDQCYNPGDTETRGQREGDLITSGICYSSCASNL